MELISREETKKAIRDNISDLKSRTEINAIINAIPTIEEVPSDYAEGYKKGYIDGGVTELMSRPKGEWKMLSSGFFECTNCKCRLLFPIFSNGEYATYCPNCGAEMRGEE